MNVKEKREKVGAAHLPGKNMAEIQFSGKNRHILSRAKMHVIKFGKGIDYVSLCFPLENTVMALTYKRVVYQTVFKFFYVQILYTYIQLLVT